jgi:LPS sulfotransferase NodH
MPSRAYLMCSIERTGSDVLAEALMQTGLAALYDLYPRHRGEIFAISETIGRDSLCRFCAATGAN